MDAVAAWLSGSIMFLLTLTAQNSTTVQGRRHGMDWVDMSTPLLPEVVPKIYANPVSFYSGGGGFRGRSWFGA